MASFVGLDYLLAELGSQMDLGAVIPRLLELMQSGTELQMGQVHRPSENLFPEWVQEVSDTLRRVPSGESVVADWQALSTPTCGAGGRYDADSLRRAISDRLGWLAALAKATLKPAEGGHLSQMTWRAVEMPDPRNVFVVHGRDHAIRDAIFSFLRSLQLHPLEWSQLLAATGRPAPYIGEILDAGLCLAQAIVVVMTPDDEARLRLPFRTARDPSHEVKLTPQARPNVIFEAGMAMGRAPNRTVLVEVGSLRPFSDIGGIHTVRLDNSSMRRQELAQRLKSAGCAIDLTGTDWHRAGNFELADI